MEWHNVFCTGREGRGVGVNHWKGDTVGCVVCSVRAHCTPVCSAAPPTTLQRSLLPPGSPCQNPVFRVGSLAPHVTNQRHRTTMTVTGERQNPCLARELEDDDVAPLRRGGREEEEDAPSLLRQPAKISCRPSLQGRLFGGCRSLARSPADTPHTPSSKNVDASIARRRSRLLHCPPFNKGSAGVVHFPAPV